MPVTVSAMKVSSVHSFHQKIDLLLKRFKNIGPKTPCDLLEAEIKE